jgi:hypothetical protein
VEQLAVQEPGEPDELAVLVGELAEELQPATAAWVVEALALLGAAGEAAERLRCRAEALREASPGWAEPGAVAETAVADTAVADTRAADAAVAAGDWRRAGLLYRQLLRPDAMDRPMEPRPFRRPGSR